MNNNDQIFKSTSNYAIEKITTGSWRPGFPRDGYFVRYNFSDSFGWMSCRSFATEEEAKTFAMSL